MCVNSPAFSQRCLVVPLRFMVLGSALIFPRPLPRTSFHLDHSVSPLRLRLCRALQLHESFSFSSRAPGRTGMALFLHSSRATQRTHSYLFTFSPPFPQYTLRANEYRFPALRESVSAPSLNYSFRSPSSIPASRLFI